MEAVHLTLALWSKSKRSGTNRLQFVGDPSLIRLAFETPIPQNQELIGSAATLDYQSRVYTWTCLKMANTPRWQLIILIRSSRNLSPMHWAASQNQWLDLPLHPRKTGRPTASEAEPRHNIAANNCPLQKNKHLKSSFRCRMKSIPPLKPPTNGSLVIYQCYIQFEQAEFCTQLVVKWQPCL